MGLWEGSSTSLEGPRSHLGSAQEAGETEERFVLPFSRFGSLSGGGAGGTTDDGSAPGPESGLGEGTPPPDKEDWTPASTRPSADWWLRWGAALVGSYGPGLNGPGSL